MVVAWSLRSNQDVTLALYKTVELLHWDTFGWIAKAVLTLLICTYFITSSDSGTLVIRLCSPSVIRSRRFCTAPYGVWGRGWLPLSCWSPAAWRPCRRPAS